MAQSHSLPKRWICIAALTLAAAAPFGLIGLAARAQDKTDKNSIPRDDVQACQSCHAGEMGAHKAVNADGLARSPHKDLKCQDCHSAITSAPHTPEMLKEKAACGNCHTDQIAAFNKSTHMRQDYSPGDHPNCIFCHGKGDPHAITAGAKWSRAQKVAVCTQCHQQKERMGRYRVDPDAVSSYEESFHGKTLLRFGNLKVAICTDCHGHHDVLSPNNPAAPTHRDNAAKTCGQQGCHVGAKVNFAMSGANHLRLKLKESPVLSGELLFFRTLLFGMIGVMLTIIMLDLRKEVFGPPPGPKSGRLVASLISLSFICMVTSLGLAAMEKRSALWCFLAANAIMFIAFGIYFATRRKNGHDANEKKYHRLSITLRLHHFFLMISFTLLALTGLPLRFANTPGVPSVHILFGGLGGARLVHRTAAVIMVSTWIWHVIYLLLRWRKAGFSMKSWTMLPTRKDLSDAILTLKHYLGGSHEEPKFGRFQFREKLDYLAEYWGIPVMVLSGLVLWFPIYFGNRLPDIGLSFAYIAHSWEATLAFLAILTWHLYNAHFNPNTFPMNKVWMTGTMSRSEMEREHPLELEEIEAGLETMPAQPEETKPMPRPAKPSTSFGQ